MTVEIVDGIKVLKLQDDDAARAEARKAMADDMRTLAHLFSLLSGGHGMRDGTVFERRVL